MRDGESGVLAAGEITDGEAEVEIAPFGRDDVHPASINVAAAAAFQMRSLSRFPISQFPF